MLSRSKPQRTASTRARFTTDVICHSNRVFCVFGTHLATDQRLLNDSCRVVIESQINVSKSQLMTGVKLASNCSSVLNCNNGRVVILKTTGRSQTGSLYRKENTCAREMVKVRISSLSLEVSRRTTLLDHLGSITKKVNCVALKTLVREVTSGSYFFLTSKTFQNVCLSPLSKEIHTIPQVCTIIQHLCDELLQNLVR